ncbi:MAG: hypothetical protein ONA90_07325, partial [candidate division KSB1 bacterium]|nr:hypothetical protein [candidate division KSB1 bacterium]
HTFYSGSTERTSFNEAGYTSGYIRGDLQKQSWEYVRIPSRPMLRLPAIDCAGQSPAEIMAALEQSAAAEIDDALVSIELHNLSRDAYLQLDLSAIDQLFASAFHFEKKLYVVTEISSAEGGDTERLGHIGSLRDEFARYLASHADGALPREELEARGVRYLVEAESKETEAS